MTGFAILFAGLFIYHPFFISMTELNYNHKDKLMEVSVRVFSDDLEKAVRRNCNCKIGVVNASDKNAVGAQLSDYIGKHLKLKVDGKVVAMRYVGYQQEEGSIWTFFEVPGIAAVRKVEVLNNLLYEETEQQVNMIRVQGYGKERTDKLEYPKVDYSFSF